MRFRVLGAVEVVDGAGSSVPLGPRKQRLLLALLACRPGATVTTDELVEAVWDPPPPPSAGENLRAYVQSLRRLLGAGLVLGNRRVGYVLAVDPAAVDSVEFARSARDGAAALRLGDAATARALLNHGLALWRGQPFAGIVSGGILAAEATRLEEQRLAALEDRFDADLRCGAAGDLVPEIEELVRQHPYRERLYGLLMVALYRAGRQADALNTYRLARDTLAEELGVDPSEELRRTERAILRREGWLERPVVTAAEAGPRVTPAELPAVTNGFTGRGAELGRLDELTTSQGAAPVVAIVGVAGVGKTALAVEWGHRAADRFPDGQVLLDLRGFHPGRPVQPREALGRLLRTFDAEPARVPADVDEAAALYRSVLARRNVLIVLDNAGSVEQVRPLLPGTAGCVVLVTSRNRMPGLIAHNAASHLVLDPLSETGAVDLLQRVLDPAVVGDAAPAAMSDLAAACGYLPLALRIAAANLAERRLPALARYVEELRSGNRLDALETEGDEHRAVRRAFDLSYAALTGPQQELFRLLGLVPGPGVTPPSAAALAGRSVADARAGLERLAAAHLLHGGPDEWFAFHDLIGEYARNRVRADDPATRDSALDRLLAHYVDAADAAAQVLYPQTLRLPSVTPAPAGTLTRPQALAWFGAQLPNLVAACREAADRGHPAAWLIADAARGYCSLQSTVTEWQLIAEAGYRAAEAAGDLAGMACAALNLAHCTYNTGDLETAARHYEEALALSRRAGWAEGEATILSNAAIVFTGLGDLPRAVEYQQAALAAQRAVGAGRGEAVALLNLAVSYACLGRLREAQQLFRDAVARLRAGNWLIGQATALANLAEVLLLMDDRAGAHDAAAEARRIAEEAGEHDVEVHARALISAIRCANGDADGALHEALEACAQLRLPGEHGYAAGVHKSLATAYEALGDDAQAVLHHRLSHRYAVAPGHRYIEVDTAINLATAEYRIGDPGAETTLLRTLEAARASGFRVLEGRALAALAEIGLDRGDLATVARHAALALDIQAETGWNRDHATLRDSLEKARSR
ncbi:AfsR/SARP family transcriptional regulator [Virgisporangium aurantiacum]|uniref:SARP family transcriptional regulator n=1 Tax=Virgisporangium aurantiacum TaxID=175570 RepID=A0A8J3Z9V4_9ACTN|nr:BTAD domain-containing putative transcriptional regulator [Virgisporangium aurantiacum]GIJ57590.1 SARP family transcriptional regulator [Virgisporangium aurantiacum]